MTHSGARAPDSRLQPPIEEAASERRRVPARALVFSAGALAVAIWGALSSPEVLAGYEALSWLLLLVPGFLLAYYRGWAGATRTMAGGSLIVLLTELVGEHAFGADIDWVLLLLIAVVLLGTGLGLGLLSELLMRQRRRVEAALRDSEERLGKIVEGAPVLLFSLDADGTFTLAEGKGLQILGLDSSDLVGRSALDVFQGDSGFVSAVRRALAGAPVSAAVPVEGSWFDCRLTPRVDEEGRRAGLIGVATDVTRQKRLEQRLLEAHKMEAIGQLAGGVAHDFNNVLTIISGNSELLLGGFESGDDGRELVREIREAADRAASLTRRLRAFSRRQTVKPEVLRIGDVAQDVEKVVRHLLGPEIDLLLGLDDWADPVRADAGLLEQVIIDLTTNARDAMPEGGKLVIEATNVELDEVYADSHERVVPGEYVMLAVSDTGSGIDPAIRPRIFEPFFTTRQDSEAAGLGLSAVYGAVKQSGGYIWVYSEPGHGSTFKIYLPSAGRATDVPPRPEPRAVVGTSRGSETLLVVDDDEEVRAVTRAILDRNGYRILEAPGGAEALEVSALHGDTIDLLVTDVVMPRMDGHELAIRLTEARPDVKVLLISGYPATIVEHHHGVLPSGMAFLQKPFSGDELARKVREVLDSDSLAAQVAREGAGEAGPVPPVSPTVPADV